MKTESNIRPASQFEIEALPPIEGRSCTVILYDNIQGPFTRQASGEDQEPQEYFTFDRYTVDTIYREGLAAAVAADTETWIQKAKEAEASGEQPSELEILTKTVTKQQAQIESINQSVDDIVYERKVTIIPSAIEKLDGFIFQNCLCEFKEGKVRPAKWSVN